MSDRPLKNLGNKFNAVDLAVMRWERELAGLKGELAELDVRIDHYQGRPGSELNQLVARFIDTKFRCDELEKDIKRVAGDKRCEKAN